MLGIPPSWLVSTRRGWRRRALRLSSVLTIENGCAIIGAFVISMPWSRRIGRVFRLLTRSCGPRISLNPSVNRLITRYLFIIKRFLPIRIASGGSRQRRRCRQVPRLDLLIMAPLDYPHPNPSPAQEAVTGLPVPLPTPPPRSLQREETAVPSSRPRRRTRCPDRKDRQLGIGSG